MEFFRHCPGCGRRFHIKLESKNLVSDHLESAPGPPPHAAIGGYRGTFVMSGDQVVIDVREFQYVYKCGHCGHEWSERRIEEQREG